MTELEAHVADADVMEWPVLGARGWRHVHAHPSTSGDWHLSTEPHLHDHVRGPGCSYDHHPLPGVTAAEDSTG